MLLLPAGLGTLESPALSRHLEPNKSARGKRTVAVNESTNAQPIENRPFEADVAKLLHLMVHSVYSDKSVFLRELVANAADACERLRFEAIATPSLLGDEIGRAHV